MKIYLIRHGETFANIEQKYVGVSESDLTTNGITNLKKLNYDFKFNKIFSSPRTRCILTAKILFNRVDEIIEDFSECNFGDFEMKTYDELKNNKEYINWINNHDTYKINNGESMNEFKSRVISKYNEVVSMDYDVTIIVCHGGVIRAIIEYLTNKNFFEIEVPYGKGYLIDNEEVTKL